MNERMNGIGWDGIGGMEWAEREMDRGTTEVAFVFRN